MLEICFKCKRERKNNSYTERTEAQMSFNSEKGENSERCEKDSPDQERRDRYLSRCSR